MIRRVERNAAPPQCRVSIDRVAEGRFCWVGSISIRGEDLFGRSTGEFNTSRRAESDAIKWARGRGAQEITIVIDEV